MDIEPLTPGELEALLLFLENTINYVTLSNYKDSEIKNLFLAYLKLQQEKHEWQESMAYTE